MPGGFYKDKYGEKTKPAPKPSTENVPGPMKAAIVMVALGTKASSEIFKNLDEHEVEQLTTEIARLDNISAEMREAILEEFHTLAMAHQFISQGGRCGIRTGNP